MAFRLTLPQLQVFDVNGEPAAGGSLSFYVTGTNNPAQTFADAALQVPNPNPIVLDARGSCPAPFLLPTQQYKVVLTNSTGVVVWTVDPVSDPTSTGESTIAPFSITGNAETNRFLQLQSSGVNRFLIGLDSSDESGNNAGSDLIIATCNDAGQQNEVVATFNRQTGQIDFQILPTFGGGQAFLPAGMIMPYAGPAQTIPGWLLCDGTLYESASYPALYNNIGGIWNQQSDTGNVFRVPDLRGYFIRGLDPTGSVDPTARSLGTIEQDALQAFTVTTAIPVAPTGGLGSPASGQATSPIYASPDDNYTGVIAGANSTTLRTSSETRPKNIAMSYFIKT